MLIYMFTSGGRHNMDLADLMNEVWVLPPEDNMVGEVALKAFRARGLDYPRTTVFSDSPHVRMALVASGRFLSIFPASALRFPTSHPGIKKLPVELPTRVPVGIVTLRNERSGRFRDFSSSMGARSLRSSKRESD